MERKMRHSERELNVEDAKKLLVKGKTGTLAVNGDDGYPYAVPVNYIYMDDAVYIHSAKYGYKIDAVSADSKVCLSVILYNEIIESETTTKFESVIVTGNASVLTEDDEKQRIMEGMVKTLAPSNINGGMETIKKLLPAVCIIKIDISKLSGKAYR